MQILHNKRIIVLKVMVILHNYIFNLNHLIQIMSDDPGMGRYIIATRDLKPGELILAESPIAVAPMAVTPPVCLVCYKSVDGRTR